MVSTCQRKQIVIIMATVIMANIATTEGMEILVTMAITEIIPTVNMVI